LNNNLENNLTHIKRMSDEATLQNQLLSKRNQELDEFAYIISHDLKAPFRNLEGLLNVLENGQPERKEKAKTMIQEQLSRINKLINNISSYSRAGREKVEKNKVSLSDLLRDIIRSLNVPANIQILLENHFPVLHTEEVYLEQVFTNLLSNAIKYNNHEKGIIRIGYQPDKDGKILLFVEDNGPGIPHEKREQIFKMFVMLDNGQQNDSSGIGLAIVKKIIDEKGGSIWIEDSKTDVKGSRFTFNWPADLIE
jgi:signal transduction histidine kinase